LFSIVFGMKTVETNKKYNVMSCWSTRLVKDYIVWYGGCK
jgi:hypothetical protein